MQPTSVEETSDFRELENHGVIEQPARETDFQASGLTGITYTLNEPEGNWLKYFGDEGEKQHGVYFDSFSCVTFSALRVICLQINRLITQQLLPVETMHFLQTQGYLDEKGLFNVSERFTAKMSGTTREGNSFVKVWDSIRKDGLLPQKDWDFPTEQRTPVFDWDNYYAEIPQELQDKAKTILQHLSFAYEWVIAGQTMSSDSRAILLEQHLQHAPLQIASPVCKGWGNGGTTPVPNCGITTAQHATVIAQVVDEGFKDVDSYIPFIKLLAHDYPFIWVLKGVVEVVEPQPVPAFQEFNTALPILYGQKNDLVKRLQAALVKLGYLDPQYITGFYWVKTQAAVLKFQLEQQVDTPTILKSLNGKRVGVKTLTKLNYLLSTHV